MKVVLIYPNQTYASFIPMMRKHRFVNIKPRPNPMISLGMLYIHDSIKDLCDVIYIDNNIEKKSPANLLSEILNQNPDVVGFGGTITEWTEAKNISTALRKLNIITIYGGPNATANPEKHVKYFDFVLRGWGEDSFNEFITALMLGDYSAFEDIRGLCWENHIVDTCLNCNYKFIGYPSRKQINLNNYRRAQFNLPNPVDIVVASRGCPFECKFCSSKSIWNKCYKKRPVDEILEEIKYMQKTFGTKSIHFREDNLTVNKNFLEELCRGLKDLKIDWICQSRVPSLNKEIILMMKDAGCKVICCGFESANDSTLKYIDKGFSFAQVCKIIITLEECQIHYSGGFMVGVLNEGENEIQKTLAFTRTISQYPHSLIPRGAGRFVGWPRSEIYNEIENNKELVAYNWEDGEQLIPHTYKLKAHEVEDCISRYW